MSHRPDRHANPPPTRSPRRAAAALIAFGCGAAGCSLVVDNGPPDATGSDLGPELRTEDRRTPDASITTADAAAGGEADSDGDWGYRVPACGDETVQLERVDPASVLMVLDRSSSMAGEPWQQAQGALAEVLEAHERHTRFGLLLYPQHAEECKLAPEPHVGFALENATPIVQTMKAEGTSHGTPTGGALRAAAGIFEAGVPAGERVLIVATDGMPGCPADCSTCQATGDGGCLDGRCDHCADLEVCMVREILDAVAALRDLDVAVYVVGLPGSEDAAGLLDEMATIGGTAATGSTKSYYDVGDADALADALTDIAADVGSCSVQLDPTPGYAFMVVEIDGETATRDTEHQDGWDLLAGDVLQLYGSACEAASAAEAEVTVRYGCKY